MKVLDFLDDKCIITDIKGKNKKEVVTELIEILAKEKRIKDADSVVEAIMKRESIGSTGIGQGVALPHAKCEDVSDIVAALGISRMGVDFDSLDDEPVHIVFLMIAPPKSVSEHLKALAKISRLLKDKFFRQSLREAQTAQEIVKLIKEEDAL
jgi:fructose-specific phosphotransferase system IIA component